ncbi:MAG: HIRAN protein [Betaproteobacteria bacterium]|nr:HIRAN protein [Betaproteobacteria bacterium]
MRTIRTLVLLLCVLATPANAQDKANARILLQSVLTAGLRHHDAKAVWDDLKAGDPLSLVREAGNPHDSNAVRVDWKDKTLGYLPKTENGFVARQLDRGNRLEARIASLGKYRNHRRRLEIEIYAPL